MLRYQLLRPLVYLTISDAGKAAIDWTIPFFLALATAGLYGALGQKPQLFMANGVLSQVSGLLQVLPGFYIAALAAIATFQRLDLDELLPPPTPKVDAYVRGEHTKLPLTRRRMLSLLFSYLSFLSIFLFIIVIAANFIAESIRAVVPVPYRPMMATTFLFAFSFLFWNMVVVTLFGLYQLGDRLHQPDTPD